MNGEDEQDPGPNPPTGPGSGDPETEAKNADVDEAVADASSETSEPDDFVDSVLSTIEGLVKNVTHAVNRLTGGR